MAKQISLDMYQKTRNGYSMSAKNIYQVAYALYETGEHKKCVDVLANSLGLTIEFGMIKEVIGIQQSYSLFDISEEKCELLVSEVKSYSKTRQVAFHR